MSDCILYHYSDKDFVNYQKGVFELLTKEAQGIVSKEERKEAEDRAKFTLYPGPYTEHISFFIDPIPSKIIAGVFNNQHPFWQKGTKLFEYCVPLSEIDLKAFVFVETPSSTDFFYNRSENLVGNEYYQQLLKLRKLNGEVGTSKQEFKSAYNKLKGKTEEGYLLLPSRPNFEEIKTKYAATVPHVMLYPKNGTIIGTKINKLVIGSDKRELVTINRSSKVLADW